MIDKCTKNNQKDSGNRKEYSDFIELVKPWFAPIVDSFSQTKAAEQQTCHLCYRPIFYPLIEFEGLINDTSHKSVFNHRCFSSTVICEPCANSLPYNHSFCFSCGIQLPIESIGRSHMPSCGACLAKTPLQFRSVCAFDYTFPLPEWVSNIKYQGQLTLLKPLSALFAEFCVSAYQDDTMPELLVSVPLHPNREFVRGFNQADLFSNEIADLLNIPYQQHVLKRVRNTAAQMSLSMKDRDKNMSKAFQVIQAPKVKHIAVFDDIMTTGSTLKALALPLKQSGIERIDFWSLCRTPKPET